MAEEYGDAWRPVVADGPEPIHERLAQAVAADIRDDRLVPGARLPAHRVLADALGLSVGTVTRAYANLAAQGLVEADRGRGMFVARATATGAPDRIDLSLNVPPPVFVRDDIDRLLRAYAARAAPADFSRYAPVEGDPAHRRLIADLVGGFRGLALDPGLLMLTGGAQQALFVALAAAPEGAVAAERLAYPGFLRAARRLGRHVVAVEMDEEGLVPASLRAALAGPAAPRVVYCMPALQNPTGAVMNLKRREEIAAIARAADATIIEDDAYAACDPGGAPTLAALAPERVFYVSGLSKALGPAFRIGLLAPPEGRREESLSWLQAMQTMPSALSCALLVEATGLGLVERALDRLRAEIERRNALARAVLRAPELRGPPRSPHLWLPLPADRARALAALAAAEGITLPPPEAFLADPEDERAGLRICVGGADDAAISDALTRFARLLRGGAPAAAAAWPVV